MSDGTLFPTKEGTPQGSVISPCLSNLTLDGLEHKLHSEYDRARRKGRRAKVFIVRYADDFVISGSSKELLEEDIKPMVEQILGERGLELSKEKTHITHIDEGFDFLGQNIRKYNGKLLIKPSKSSQKKLLQKVRDLAKEFQAAPQILLLIKLNQVIRGWANYHRHVVSGAIFGRLDHEIWQVVWRWAKRRHPKKGNRWIKRRYFRRMRGRDWNFACEEIDDDGNKSLYRLRRLSETPIVRHVKIRGDANPFDPEWEVYFERRTQRKMRDNLRGQGRLLSLYNRQHGVCPACGQKLDEERGWELHHRTRRVDGGSDRLENLVLLHPNCHKQIHA